MGVGCMQGKLHDTLVLSLKGNAISSFAVNLFYLVFLISIHEIATSNMHSWNWRASIVSRVLVLHTVLSPECRAFSTS